MTRDDTPDPEERWILIRGQHDPYTYPFRSREEAEDFALDHCMLDWRPERNDDPKKEHTPICARCKEAWPCTHQQLDDKASLILSAARNACHRCGKDIGGIAIRIAGGGPLGEDVAYHGRKGPCLRMARRELVRLGRAEQLAEFDADLRRRDEDNHNVRLRGPRLTVCSLRLIRDLRGDEHALLDPARP